MKKYLLTALILCSSLFARAQESGDLFAGWMFTEVNYTFQKPKIYLLGYVECDNYNFNRFDCIYGRFGVGYKPLKWLKFGVNYVPLYEVAKWHHMIEADLMGALNSGDFSVSIRERYRHDFTVNYNELRSRLKVAYSIPDSKFTPYLAAEVFTWGTTWLKTRHYVACDYDILPYMQLEFYYLYYAFAHARATHALGLGLNFNF